MHISRRSFVVGAAASIAGISLGNAANAQDGEISDVVPDGATAGYLRFAGCKQALVRNFSSTKNFNDPANLGTLAALVAFAITLDASGSVDAVHKAAENAIVARYQNDSSLPFVSSDPAAPISVGTTKLRSARASIVNITRSAGGVNLVVSGTVLTVAKDGTIALAIGLAQGAGLTSQLIKMYEAIDKRWPSKAAVKSQSDGEMVGGLWDAIPVLADFPVDFSLAFQADITDSVNAAG